MGSSPGALPFEGSEDAAEPWLRALLGLPELGMRVPWLRERFEADPPALLGARIDRVAARNHAGDERAREALLSVALCLATLRDSALLATLREVARREALLDLDRLVRAGTDEPLESEAELRVPAYRKGRELTLGERRSLARSPSRLDLQKLLFDPDPLVLTQLFACPKLTEDDVVRVLSLRPARQVAMTTALGAFRWMSRRRVRQALVLNPGCPHGLALPLLSTLPREDLALVVSSAGLPAPLRAVAVEILGRLPPLAVGRVGWQ